MKIFKKLYLLLSLAVVLPFASCSDDDNDSRFETIDIPSELLAEGIAVEPAGGTTSFVAKSSVPVQTRIESADVDKDGNPTDASWLTASVSGNIASGYTVTVAAEPNEGKTARSAKVHVFAQNVARTVLVKQTSAYVVPEPGPDATIKDISAIDLAKLMTTGVNIGNTMEVPSGETGWGNPKVNQEYIKGLKALGFNAVRVPCAWDSHVTDKNKNTIDPDWLARVDEVVGWIVAEGMYAIVNIHWDGGWLENNVQNAYSEEINKKQHDYWTQIAAQLKRYDEHLLFAGMNEPGYNTDAQAEQSVQNIIKYQQTFINAVRATGGNNSLRHLIVQAPSTNIDLSVKDNYIKHMPVDPVSGKLFVEVHFYDPSDFTILEKDNDWFQGSRVKWFWGAANLVAGSDRNSTGHDENSVATQFAKMKSAYADKGIPVILGEYATSIRSNATPLDKHEASRALWNEVVTREARKNGCIPFYWETGGDINRTDGKAKCQYAIDGIMRGLQASTYPF
ncbi:MAG: cellulase family glycosylhydrolase [Muribaculum sp.]